MATKKTQPAAASKGFTGPRAAVAQDAQGRLQARSFYVDKTDENGRRVGQERTINAAVDSVAPIAVEGSEIIVSAVVYDANQTEFARPVRLVLTPEEARTLGADLTRWAGMLSGGGA